MMVAVFHLVLGKEDDMILRRQDLQTTNAR